MIEGNEVFGFYRVFVAFFIIIISIGRLIGRRQTDKNRYIRGNRRGSARNKNLKTITI